MSNKTIFRKKIFLSICIANLLFLTFFLIALFMLFEPRFISLETCKLEANSNFRNFCFYSEKWNENTYLSLITNFYTTIITIFVALQALLGYFAFFIFKNSNKRIIEEEVKNELPNYFNSKNSDILIQQTMKPLLEKLLIEQDSIINTAARIQELEYKVEQLSNQLSQYDERDEYETPT